MAAITISKQYATNSEQIAALLAKRLGWEYIGKRLVAGIAGELRISESEVNTFLKTSESRVLRLLDRYTCEVVQRVVDQQYGCLDDKTYHEATKRLVERLYEAGKVIIVGWGAQCILRDKADVLHVKLRADEEAKIRRVMERQNLDREGARNLIQREEGHSRDYIRHFFKQNWDDPGLYDLVIDTGEISPKEAVEQIREALELKLAKLSSA